MSFRRRTEKIMPMIVNPVLLTCTKAPGSLTALLTRFPTESTAAETIVEPAMDVCSVARAVVELLIQNPTGSMAPGVIVGLAINVDSVTIDVVELLM